LDGRFGGEIADVVAEVTENRSLGRAKRIQVEHAPHPSPRARLVELADEINILREILSSPPLGWSEKRKSDDFNWATQVVDSLRGAHLQLAALSDGLMARRPRRPIDAIA
jgi:guanosine-3',5'-bis(diphosphate) 3'-pyrophosphohydrolase